MFSSWWSKGSSSFPYEIGPELGEDKSGEKYFGSFANLHEGICKSDKSKVGIFVCNTTSEGSGEALRAIKRLKTLRHPSIVTYLDSQETDKTVFLATESVIPLLLHLKENQAQENYLAWGILQVFRGVAFLHDASLIHGRLHGGSVFVTPAGEWKLFGLERMTSMQKSEDDYSLARGASNKAFHKYSPPEVRNNPSLEPSTEQDIWGLGCIVWEVFNGSLSQPNDLARLGRMPKKLTATYMELVAANPSKRPRPRDKIKELSSGSNAFFKNDLIDTMVFLEELQIQGDQEKTRFFSALPGKIDQFPPEISTNKILPELIKAFDYSNAGSLILAPVFKIGKLLKTSEEYQAKIIPCLVKLFASSDRNARFKLLSQIENFVEHLNNKVVNEQVFPQIQNGFVDKEPIIREKTVIAMIHLAPKLTYANLDENVVMKHFSRLLRDEQPGIRTNTTVCLGKIARYLHYSTRQKVLASAFGGKLKDPFPPARIAAINALAATQQYYTLQETSSRVLPMLCTLMTDPEKPVREQTFKVCKGFIEKLEQVSDNPDLREEMEAEVTSTSSQVISQASGWATWAVGAIGAKFYKSANKPPAAETSVPVNSVSRGSQERELDENSASTTSKGAMRLNFETTREDVEQEDIVVEDDNDEDGWKDDDAEWASLEDAFTESQTKTKKETDSFFDCQDSTLVKSEVVKQGVQTLDLNDWNDDDWTNSSFGVKSEGGEDKKKQREEKRLQRQKEIEAKRAAKKGGAMKLGAKKAF